MSQGKRDTSQGKRNTSLGHAPWIIGGALAPALAAALPPNLQYRLRPAARRLSVSGCNDGVEAPGDDGVPAQKSEKKKKGKRKKKKEKEKKKAQKVHLELQVHQLRNFVIHILDFEELDRSHVTLFVRKLQLPLTGAAVAPSLLEVGLAGDALRRGRHVPSAPRGLSPLAFVIGKFRGVDVFDTPIVAQRLVVLLCVSDCGVSSRRGHAVEFELIARDLCEQEDKQHLNQKAGCPIRSRNNAVPFKAVPAARARRCEGKREEGAPGSQARARAP